MGLSNTFRDPLRATGSPLERCAPPELRRALRVAFYSAARRQLTALFVAWSNTSVNAKHWQDLTSTVTALAVDSILIQKRIDEHAQVQRQQFVSLLAMTQEPVRSLLMPLAPSVQRVVSHTVRCSVRMTKEQGIEGSVLLSPLNVGFSLLHHKSASEEASLTVEVVAVPVSVPIRHRTQ